jgi:plastocyanin
MKEVVKCSLPCLFATVLALIFTGCSNAPQKAKAYTVEIKDMKFVPEVLTVHKGDTVIWINKDIMAHDVTEEASKTWTSGPISAGGTWKMEINDAAGYYCSIHSVMKGKLELE